jgi:hypothetical protein
MLSQLSRYGTVRKLQVDDVRMSVTTRWHIEGSIIAGTVRSQPLEFDLHIAVESPEPAEKVATMLRVAEQTCYVVQSLRAPLNKTYSLNGRPLELTPP